MSLGTDKHGEATLVFWVCTEAVPSGASMMEVEVGVEKDNISYQAQ